MNFRIRHVLRIWHVLVVIAGVVALGLVKAIASQSWPPLDFFWSNPLGYLREVINPEIFGGCIGLLILLPVTVLVIRIDGLHKRLDATGPVEALARPGSLPPWSLGDLGAVIASELESLNAVVFVDDRSQTMRIMIDPASSITIEHPTMDNSTTDISRRSHDRGPSVVGRWLQVRWKQGRAPKFKLRESPVSPAIDATGRLIPRWRGQSKPDPTHQAVGRQALFEGQRREISFTTSTSELIKIVDEVASRGGWAGQAELNARNRRIPRTDKTYSVDRRSESTGQSTGATTVTTKTVQSGRPGVHASGQQTFSTSNAGTASHQTNSATPDTNARLVRTFVGVGIAILAGCVIATVIGLIAGMVWWAGLIIIGSGLFFFLIFSLPVWLLLGRQPMAGVSEESRLTGRADSPGCLGANRRAEPSHPTGPIGFRCSSPGRRQVRRTNARNGGSWSCVSVNPSPS